MATITPVMSSPGGRCSKISWETLTTGDTATEVTPSRGEPVGSVQVTGTFGGATVVIEGTNDGTNYVTLKDAQGNDVSFTAAGMTYFQGLCLSLRPAISGGTSDDVDVTIIFRGIE